MLLMYLRSDISLQKINPVRDCTTHCWPNKRDQLQDGLRQYCSYRDELSVINGIVIKGEGVVTAKQMQTEILR